MSDFESGPNDGIVSPLAVSEDMARAVRLHCLPGTGQTIKDLARDAGLKPARLYKLLSGAKSWGAHEALSVGAVMGAAKVTTGLLRRIGMTAAQAEAAEGVSLPDKLAEIATHYAVLARAGADNRIDHAEEKQCEVAVAAISESLEAFRAGKG